MKFFAVTDWYDWRLGPQVFYNPGEDWHEFGQTPAYWCVSFHIGPWQLGIESK